MSERTATIFVIDDAAAMRESLQWLLSSQGFAPEIYSCAEDFLKTFDPAREGCILLDMRMPNMSGMELMAELEARGNLLPIIILTGHGDIPMTVQAIKRGAFDFLQKPFNSQVLLDTINAALLQDGSNRLRLGDRHRLRALFESLTPRETDVMKLVVAGESSKSAGKRLGISGKTVDIHRASILKKLKARNIAELIQTWMTFSSDSR